MFNICSLYIYYMFIIYLLYIYYMLIIYLLYIYYMLIIYLSYVYYIFIIYVYNNVMSIQVASIELFWLFELFLATGPPNKLSPHCFPRCFPRCFLPQSNIFLLYFKLEPIFFNSLISGSSTSIMHPCVQVHIALTR